MAQESEDKPLDLEGLRAGIVALFDRPADGYYLIADDTNGERGGRADADVRVERLAQRPLLVDPERFRSAGASHGKASTRALHEHVRDAARADRECCGLRLYVERENTGAQATYHAMGMVETHYRLYEEEFVRS